MEKFKTSECIKPKDAELNWVFIDLPGKEDLNGKPRFVASLKVHKDAPGCKDLQDRIEEFWFDNRPNKKAKPKSLGFNPEKVRGDDDEMHETDYIMFNFWTGTHYKNKDGSEGDVCKTGIFNAKGKKVDLGDKKIGNDSKGAISGSMDIYDNGPGAQGVTLYLNAIQLTKFVAYSGDPDFGDQSEDEEDSFEGVENEFEGTTEGDAKPRL